MSEFRFVLITVAIILGLGLTQIIRDIGLQIRKRSDIEIYPLQIAVSCLLFFSILMWIWGFSAFVDAAWTIYSYLLLLMPASGLALSTQVISLDLSSDETPEEQYFRNSRPLYLILSSVLILGVAASIAKSEYLSASRESLIMVNSARLLFAGIFASLGFIRKPAFHWLVLSVFFVAVTLAAFVNLFILQLQ